MQSVGINEVNFFPEFVPLTKGSPKWEENSTHCGGCHNEFHMLLKRREHCTVCGQAFCDKCCRTEKIYNNHHACGGCVANGMMMIKTRYDKKRMDQMSKHHEKYHKDAAQAKRDKEANEPKDEKKDTDDLYGRAFEALQTEQTGEKLAALQAKPAPLPSGGVVGINEVNFFPDFMPLRRGDPKWEDGGTHCTECHNEFHMLANPATNCTVCGHTFCERCCRSQRVYNNHSSCGACLANGMMMIKTRYDKKRMDQLSKHHEKYHKDAAQAKRDKEANEPKGEKRDTDDLYGRAYEALATQLSKSGGPSEAAANIAGVGVNEINLFPDFVPLKKGSAKWDAEGGTHCAECHNEYHVLTHTKTNCTVCGNVFCNHCCQPQRVYNNHNSCGGCVANAQMMIKQRYDEKRRAQLKAHTDKYHPAGERKRSSSRHSSRASSTGSRHSSVGEALEIVNAHR